MKYKSYIFIKNIIEKKFSMPNEGKIVMFGVGGEESSGESFFRLIRSYGEDRVLGYDINSKVDHPNIFGIDLNNLSLIPEHRMAFCDIDVGDFRTHWKIRLKILHWCSSRMVRGGLIMTNSPKITKKKWGNEGYNFMIKNGFICKLFEQYEKEDWAKKMVEKTKWHPKTTCLYLKK